MAKAEDAMKEFLPKTSTYLKSAGNTPVKVDIIPGSKETTGSARLNDLKKRVSDAKGLRAAAQKALVKAKAGPEKIAAEKMLAKALNQLRKASVALAIMKNDKS